MVREEAAERAQHPTAASATAVEKAARRVAPMMERDLRGALAAAKGRAKREQTTVRSHAKPSRIRDGESMPALRPGSFSCVTAMGQHGKRRDG